MSFCRIATALYILVSICNGSDDEHLSLLQTHASFTMKTGTPDGLDELEPSERVIEDTDEQIDFHECRKWCYSKKHKDKAWEGHKCDWYACSTCAECPPLTPTPTSNPTPTPTLNPTPSPTPAPTPNPTPNPTPSPTPAPTTTTTTTTPETTVVQDGDSCSGNDCSASVACPSGYSITKCEYVGSGASDGAYINDALECVVRGGTNDPVAPRATCTYGATTSYVVSNEMFLDQQTVSASCPDGTSAISCNCWTAWLLPICNNQATFEPNGNTCSQVIPSSGGRRRNTEGGAGAKIYALCEQDTTTVKDGDSCSGNDCSASVACPSGSSITKCEYVGSGASDGAYINDALECVVRGGTNDPVAPRATCTYGATTSYVVSNDMFLDQQTVSASCPDGTSAISCNCWTAWLLPICNNQATFEPDGNTCSQTIGSSGGRRRNTEGGAGAKIYALCEAK